MEPLICTCSDENSNAEKRGMRASEVLQGWDGDEFSKHAEDTGQFKSLIADWHLATVNLIGTISLAGPKSILLTRHNQKIAQYYYYSDQTLFLGRVGSRHETTRPAELEIPCAAHKSPLGILECGNKVE